MPRLAGGKGRKHSCERTKFQVEGRWSRVYQSVDAGAGFPGDGARGPAHANLAGHCRDFDFHSEAGIL